MSLDFTDTIPFLFVGYIRQLYRPVHNALLKQRIMYRSIKLSDISDKKERNRIRKIQRQIAIPAPEMNEYEIASVF